MIKKLDKHLAHNINSCNMSQNIMVAHKAIEKINELVDAVNELQKNATISKMEKVEPADPYAEQRKWIGKICKFWNNGDSSDDVLYGELVDIVDAPHDDCPFQCGYGEWYEYCEPVKPDDDIIYKGGDNE